MEKKSLGLGYIIDHRQNTMILKYVTKTSAVSVEEFPPEKCESRALTNTVADSLLRVFTVWASLRINSLNLV